MPATFTKVNGVLVDPNQTTTADGYPDPSFQGVGSSAANVAQPLQTVASQSLMYRGMPIGTNPATGMLVPPSGTGAIFRGVLLDDLTSYVVARGTKVAFARIGRVRSYAAAALTIGQPVMWDTSASFSGFKPFASSVAVPVPQGIAYPLDDGSASNGASAASTMAQGDSIFVDLIH